MIAPVQFSPEIKNPFRKVFVSQTLSRETNASRTKNVSQTSFASCFAYAGLLFPYRGIVYTAVFRSYLTYIYIYMYCLFVCSILFVSRYGTSRSKTVSQQLSAQNKHFAKTRFTEKTRFPTKLVSQQQHLSRSTRIHKRYIYIYIYIYIHGYISLF